jgi:hypothetical protein
MTALLLARVLLLNSFTADRIPEEDAKRTYVYDRYFFHYIKEDGLIYLCMGYVAYAPVSPSMISQPPPTSAYTGPIFALISAFYFSEFVCQVLPSSFDSTLTRRIRGEGLIVIVWRWGWYNSDEAFGKYLVQRSIVFAHNGFLLARSKPKHCISTQHHV